MTNNKITTLGIDCDDTLWPLDIYYKEIKLSIADYISQYSSFKCKDHANNLLESHMADRIAVQGVGYIMIEKAAIYTLVEIKGSIDKQDIEFIKNECHKVPNFNLPLYDGVKETLELLKQDYRLLAFTKGHPGEQKPKFKKSGLARFFDGLEIMYDKDVEHYQDALKKYKTPKNEFCMIGNSLKSDILPVIELGGQAIHIPCSDYSWVYETANDDDAKGKKFHTLEKFSELPEFLNGLS